MRVCVVTQEYPGVSDYFGGIGTLYRGLAPALVAAGAQVDVITFAPRGGTAPTELEGVRVRALPPGRSWPWHAADWARRVEVALDELGPFDAVVAPEFRGELWRYARHQRQGPAVTHLLTSSAQLLELRPGLTLLERKGPRTRLFLHMEHAQARSSAALLAPGRAVLDWARELWPDVAERPAETLPLFIRTREVREHAAAGRPPDGFPAEGGPVVTFASRLDGHKGAQRLVDAMQPIWRSRPDARLVFVGRDARFGHGMMSDHLRRLAADRADRVHVLGGQPPERYFAAIAASDLVAIPSLWESFCLAAVEAMALGKPVVGTEGHGFSEYLEPERNGLLVPRGDTEALSAAVDRLLGDEALRARLGAAASETADELDVAVVAPRYLEALGRLAGTRALAPSA